MFAFINRFLTQPRCIARLTRHRSHGQSLPTSAAFSFTISSSAGVDSNHPLTTYLQQHGATAEDLDWISDHRTRIDVLGLDYYIHSEIEWYWDRKLQRPNIAWPVQNPVGFSRVTTDYVERFRLPVMLGETNLRGTVRDRLTWLKFMEEECERLAAIYTDFRGFCWYPSIDSTDWSNFCRKASGVVDPQGYGRSEGINGLSGAQNFPTRTPGLRRVQSTGWIFRHGNFQRRMLQISAATEN